MLHAASLRLLGVPLLLALLAAPALAQDSDGDGISNALEQNGYRFSLASGDFEACTPGVDAPCYVSDPTAWSSDGDPYSDAQEVSDVNMDDAVEQPYRHPLVAAYPIIEVELVGYSFIANTTITDSQGRSLSQSSSSTYSVETTESASVKVGASASLDNVGVSTETEYSLSETRGYSSMQTSGSEVNWSTARATQLNDAATLTLEAFARNAGSATALDAQPKFNLYIGESLVGTYLPEVFQASLAPGEASAVQTINVDENSNAITLNFDQLRALQTGAPITIRVVDLLANVERWDPATSNWQCGSGADPTCSWTSFQNQILPRTLRLHLDFGYSGDPNADIPRQPFDLRANPFEYRVFVGSPGYDPAFTLRDVLSFVDPDLVDQGASVVIKGRTYPGDWYPTSSTTEDGLNRFNEAWEDAGRPNNLLDFVVPRRSELMMASPDPEDAGPVVAAAAFAEGLRTVRVAGVPKGSLPVVEAQAHVWLNGIERVVPLVASEDGAYWTTDGLLPVPASATRSYAVLTDVSGATRRTDAPLDLPVSPATSCAEVPLQDLRDASGEGTRGTATLFPDGDLDAPVEVYCDGSTTRYWVPKPTGLGNNGLYGAVWIDANRAVVVGTRSILRSTDGGHTWANLTPDGLDIPLFGLDRRPDTGTLVAAGEGGAFLRSDDNGQTWTRADTPTSRTMLDVAYVADDRWLAVGEDRVMLSEDDGRSWTGFPTPPAFSRGFVAVHFRDADTGMILDAGDGQTGGTGRSWRTADGGQTWTDVIGATGANDVAYAGDGTWYVAQDLGSNERVLRSRADGIAGSWDILDLGAQGATDPRAVAFVNAERGYVAGQAGVFRTLDGGATWTRDPALSGGSLRAVAVNGSNRGLAVGISGTLQLTTSGGGPSPVVEVASEDNGGPSVLPEAAELAPSYPNPFRDATTLSYTLPTPDRVQLAVYDLLGRRVAVLVDAEAQPAGTHHATLRADGLAAGVYLARLETTAGARTQRLTVVR